MALEKEPRVLKHAKQAFYQQRFLFPVCMFGVLVIVLRGSPQIAQAHDPASMASRELGAQLCTITFSWPVFIPHP